MEQHKQKARRKIAARGHKLLKDKSDEMVRQFMRVVKENRRLRESAEKNLAEVMEVFMFARCMCPPKHIEQAVCEPEIRAEFETSSANIMGLAVPKIKLTAVYAKEGEISLATDLNFDRSVVMMRELLPELIELANIEKTCDMLAAEIERTRRRINAIEYIMIPQIDETVRYIRMKLSENERSQQVRLMKVKEMLEGEK